MPFVGPTLVSLIYIAVSGTMLVNSLSCREPIEDVLPELSDTELRDNRVERRPTPRPRSERMLYEADCTDAGILDGGIDCP